MTKYATIYSAIFVSMIILNVTSIYLKYPDFIKGAENQCSLWDSMYEKQKQCLMDLAVQRYIKKTKKTTIINRSSTTVISLETEIRNLQNTLSSRKAQDKINLLNMKKKIEILRNENNEQELLIKKIEMDVETVGKNNSEFVNYLNEVETQNIKLEAKIQIMIEQNQQLKLTCQNKQDPNINILIGKGIN